MEPGVYLHYAIVQLWYLKWIGFFLNFGKFPVHSCLYVKLPKTKVCFRLELTSDPPSKFGRVVGKGDGYTIQITEIREDEIKGDFIPECSPLVSIIAAETYASTRNGDLNASDSERDWFDQPQGYGGPMFDRNTCNTFTSYVIKKAMLEGDGPPKPKGAIGWGLKPKFPGPPVRMIPRPCPLD